jgi:hypothetical protein
VPEDQPRGSRVAVSGDDDVSGCRRYEGPAGRLEIGDAHFDVVVRGVVRVYLLYVVAPAVVLTVVKRVHLEEATRETPRVKG